MRGLESHLYRVSRPRLGLVLSHPEIPNTNNASEFAVRYRVGKRDVSFGSRAQEGVKLEVCVIDFLIDKVSGKNKMSSLALIAEKARFGTSYALRLRAYPLLLRRNKNNRQLFYSCYATNKSVR